MKGSLEKQPSISCLYKKVFWKYAVNLEEDTHAVEWFQ